jgi:Flp pilus assembly pilin Flp
LDGIPERGESAARPRIDEDGVFEPPNGAREVTAKMLELFTNLQTLAVSLRERLVKEDGQTMAEYGVVLGVITVALVLIFGNLAGAITGTINKVIGVLPK